MSDGVVMELDGGSERTSPGDDEIMRTLERYCSMLDRGEKPPVDVPLISDASKYFFRFDTSERSIFHRYNRYVVINSHRVDKTVKNTPKNENP